MSLLILKAFQLAEKDVFKEIKRISSEGLKACVKYYSFLGLLKTFLLGWREIGQMSSCALQGKVFNKSRYHYDVLGHF